MNMSKFLSTNLIMKQRFFTTTKDFKSLRIGSYLKYQHKHGFENFINSRFGTSCQAHMQSDYNISNSYESISIWFHNDKYALETLSD